MSLDAARLARWPQVSAETRFWGKVDKADGCWLWNGTMRRDGYGRFKADGKWHLAHRWIYQHQYGSTDLVLHHTCENRRCVRPEHLLAITPQAHRAAHDGKPYGPAALNAAKTHCQRGHPLSGDNLFVRADGRRRCKTCERASKRRLAQKPEQKAKHAAYERARRKRLKEKTSAATAG